MNAALAFGQHLRETPDDDSREQLAYEAFMERWAPTDADYALAVDNLWDVAGFAAALSADLSVAQGRILDADEITADAYSDAYHMGRSTEEGRQNMLRLAAALGRAIDVAGKQSRAFLESELQRIAEREWESK